MLIVVYWVQETLMSKKAPQGEKDRASESEDTLKEQEERMEGEGQASAPGQTPQPETDPADGSPEKLEDQAASETSYKRKE